MPDVNDGVKDVLDEMEKDGIKVPKKDDKEGADAEANAKAEAKAKEEAEAKAKAEAEAEKAKEKEEEELELLNPLKFVQPWELKRLEKNLNKQLGEIAEQLRGISSRPVTPAREERKEELSDKIAEIKKVAEDAGLDPEPFAKIAEAILKATRNPELEERLEKSEEKEKEREYWEKQTELFGKEFDKTKELDEFKEDFGKLTAAETQELKQKLNKLAFGKYQNYSIRDILVLKRDELFPEKRKTAESGRGGVQRSKGSKDLSGKTVLSAEEQNDLTDEEFDTYSANLAKEHKTPLRRGGQIV